jgi:ferric-dicitrate binding protein FerR (iron transport regulator)
LETHHEHIDELLGKYLAGEASVEEKVKIEEWMDESEANRKYADHLRLIFRKASEVKERHVFDTDAAWQTVRQKLHKGNSVNGAVKPLRYNSRFFLRIAAGIIALVVIGYAILKKDDPATQFPAIAIVAENATVSDTLPNGSNVFLNKKTKLDYTYDQQRKTGVIKLSGEAYFNIEQHKEENLIVEVSGAYIRDIGTAFNIKAYPDSQTIEVVVEEGAVAFYTNDDPGIYLNAGGKGVYDKKTGKFTVEQPEANVLAYKTRIFTFEDSDLETITETLNNVYDRKIELQENLKNCRLTVSFTEENIDMIAEIIAETLGLSVRKSGNELVLEGQGCAK